MEQNTENITVSSIGAIGNDTTDGVKYVTNSTGEVVAIFVEQNIEDTVSLAISVKVDGTEKATVATNGWSDNSGANDGSTVAKAMPATAPGTDVAKEKAITVDATVTDMATVTVVSSTLDDTTSDAGSAVTTMSAR